MSDSNDADLLERVVREDSERVFPRFTHADAWKLGTIIRSLADERGHAVAIDIRRGEQQVFHAATEGSTPDNDDWVAKKIRTTLRLDVSSLVARLRADQGVYAWLDPSQYALSGGCVPVRMAGGAIVGTVTVSGLPDFEDHALVTEAMALFLSGR